MKKTIIKWLCLILALGLMLSLAACGNAQDGQEEQKTSASFAEAQKNPEPSPAPVETEPATAELTGDAESAPSEDTTEDADAGASDVLVLYFSRTGEQYVVGVIDKGNTAIVAEMIADETGADLFEILPADDHYPMTYKELTDVAKQEQNEKARPAYAGELPDLSRYDTIFIGAPVWWGDWPMILYTVFENNDFSGKTLIPFSTHEGSGLSGFDRTLASACPDSEVLDGLAVRGNDAQNRPDSVRADVDDWLSGLSY